ncbi:MAG TPA: tRNA (adenosine(37)-N6)-threonylcarbamoyltransferase complex ATPase subunit type 1 TsaE [Terriglobales bacterium]|nr:tRNA (adenosine(37)-N6)-threonylcarbamoyltransferase complex ATPase subunit type 1 TsaE [Terriglobales bacterium]
MKVVREFVTNSAEETISTGQEFSTLLHSGQLIVLRGNLGAGKTTLVKGIAEGFGAAAEEDVTSPTFNLVHEYRGANVTIFHIDLYRIDTERELMTLGIDDLRSEPGAILLVEWGEKFEEIKSHRDGEIAIEILGETQRRVSVRIS